MLEKPEMLLAQSVKDLIDDVKRSDRIEFDEDYRKKRVESDDSMQESIENCKKTVEKHEKRMVRRYKSTCSSMKTRFQRKMFVR